MSQGQGPDTERKEQGLYDVFLTGLRILLNKPYPYWHLDMHAGCGWNKKVDCQGSPLVFVDAVSEVGKDFRAMFCDRDKQAIEELRQRTFFAVERFPDSHLSVVCKDNAEALQDFAEWIASEEKPNLACGSILIDPNGPSPKFLPMEALKAFTAVHERIDIAVNVNLSFFAMARPTKGNPNVPIRLEHFPDPIDVLGLEPLKKHWLVRNPPRGGNGQRFTLFLGRNHPAAMNGFKDWYPLHSERGQLIVKHLVHIEERQMRFWEE